MTFAELKITSQFIRAAADAGIDEPTAIQQRAIPVIMAGQDVVGIAQTGTGKTAAYLLPLLQQLKYAQGHEPRCLVLVPTKELVVQVSNQLSALSAHTDLRHVALYGGIGPKAQEQALRAGVDFIIATPGRYLELYARGAIAVKRIRHLVLDECDRMMDMGFWPQLRKVQETLPHKKQWLLFSATFPEKVQRIADNFMLFPVRIEITPQATAAVTVKQVVFETPNNACKAALLLHLLKDAALHRVLVFVRTREQAAAIANTLLSHRVGQVRLLHSNKAQNARINAVNDFKQGQVRVLVSTDVSARGIDVLEVSHVINYNVPHRHEDYVHRIGRTGRAFRTGTAITFCDPAEVWHLNKIEKLMKQKVERQPMPAEISPLATPYAERQEQLREIDRQKRVDNPEFKGAFHQKKEDRHAKGRRSS